MDFKARRNDAVARLVRHMCHRDEERVVQLATTTVAKASHLAINPDNVYARYNGLVEKFIVVGRSDLAQELDLRVNAVKMCPGQENLASVLLVLDQLSYKPLERQLPVFENSTAVTDKNLTWDDILAEEPLSGDHWSEDVESPDASDTEKSDDKTETAETVYQRDDNLLSHDSNRLLTPAYTSQDHGSEPPKKSAKDFTRISGISREIIHRRPYWNSTYISQFDVLREICNAMYGLPSIFFVESAHNNLQAIHVAEDVISQLALPYISNGELQNVLEQFAKKASLVSQLRQFSQIYFVMENFPNFDYRYIFGILDGLNKAIETRIMDIESRILNSPTRSTLLTLLSEIHDLLDPYYPIPHVLRDVLSQLDEETITHVVLLNSLYSAIKSYAIQDDSFRILVDIFNQVLKDYFVPLQWWLCNGELKLGVYEHSFMVIALDTKAPIELMWTTMFGLRDSKHVPVFLQPFAGDIFHIGKSVTLSKLLGSTSINNGISFEFVATASIDLVDLFDLSFQKYFLAVRNQSHALIVEVVRKTNLYNIWQLHFNIYFMLDKVALYDFLSRIYESSKKLLDTHYLNDCLQECWLTATSKDAPFAVLNCYHSSADELELLVPTNRALANLIPKEHVHKLQKVWNNLFLCSRTQFRLKEQRRDPASFHARLYIDKLMLYFHLILQTEAEQILSQLYYQSSIQALISLNEKHLMNAFKGCFASTELYVRFTDFLHSCENDLSSVKTSYDILIYTASQHLGSSKTANYLDLLSKP